MYRVVRIRPNKADPKGKDLDLETWRGSSRATANKEFAKAVAADVEPHESIQLMQRLPEEEQSPGTTAWEVLAMYGGKRRGVKKGLLFDKRSTVAAREKFLKERRSRLTEAEFAHAKKGKCVWQISDRAFDGRWCPKRAPADNLYCREHQRFARDLYGWTGR